MEDTQAVPMPEHIDALKADVEKVKSWSGYSFAAIICAVLGAGMWCGRLSTQVEQVDKHLVSIDAWLAQASKDSANQQRLEQRVDDIAGEVSRLRDGHGPTSTAPVVVPPRVPYTGSGRPY